MILITVRHRESGVPISGQQLTLEFGGKVVGWTKLVATDDEGKACFKVAPTTKGTLFVNGHRFYQGEIKDGAVVFLEEGLLC